MFIRLGIVLALFSVSSGWAVSFVRDRGKWSSMAHHCGIKEIYRLLAHSQNPNLGNPVKLTKVSFKEFKEGLADVASLWCEKLQASGEDSAGNVFTVKALIRLQSGLGGTMLCYIDHSVVHPHSKAFELLDAEERQIFTVYGARKFNPWPYPDGRVYWTKAYYYYNFKYPPPKKK